LTAASVTNLPADDTRHFFWIPSVDESLGLIEKQGGEQLVCARVDGREWQVSCQVRGERVCVAARDIHLAALKALLATYQRSFQKQEESQV
jgi:hypothetical protein